MRPATLCRAIAPNRKAWEVPLNLLGAASPAAAGALPRLSGRLNALAGAAVYHAPILHLSCTYLACGLFSGRSRPVPFLPQPGGALRLRR